jgi:hypothetical protein
MDSLIQFLRNPFAFNYDFDRNRRNGYVFYGEYKPTKLKRLMIWLMNEKIDPIDWEEVPPFKEPEMDFNLKAPRPANIKYYECYTQPNMLTQNDIYFRRLLLVGVFYKIYSHLEKKVSVYQNVYIMSGTYYNRFGMKMLMLVWFYYMACRMFVHKDYQMPYN